MIDTSVEYPAGPAIAGESRAPVTYDAFISYSHAKDKPIATALQSVVQKLNEPRCGRRAFQVPRRHQPCRRHDIRGRRSNRRLAKSRFLVLLASLDVMASPIAFCVTAGCEPSVGQILISLGLFG